MSSRQEEKERRRQERLAQEQAEAASAARMRRIQIALGSLIAVAAVVGVVIAITSSGGGGGGNDKAQSADSNPKAAVPPVRETNLAAAAKAAGCQLLNPPSEGRNHTTDPVTYKNSNPPASGPHNPVPADDGIYAPGNEPAKEHWVHSLEHGRILIQYKPGTTAHVRDQLETVGSEELRGTAGYHVLVFENNTNMPYAVAAVAWTHVLGCKRMNDRVFDAIRAFRTQYTDKGPELIP
jgi:hypothetical protein